MKTWTTLPLKCDYCGYETHVEDAMIEHVERHRRDTASVQPAAGDGREAGE